MKILTWLLIVLNTSSYTYIRNTHTGDYMSKVGLSIITNTKIDGNTLYFKVSTPISNKYGELVGGSVNNDAMVKAIYFNNTITTLWIQGLPSVFESDYVEDLLIIQDSFRLAHT